MRAHGLCQEATVQRSCGCWQSVAAPSARTRHSFVRAHTHRHGGPHLEVADRGIDQVVHALHLGLAPPAAALQLRLRRRAVAAIGLRGPPERGRRNSAAVGRSKEGVLIAGELLEVQEGPEHALCEKSAARLPCTCTTPSACLASCPCPAAPPCSPWPECTRSRCGGG